MNILAKQKQTHRYKEQTCGFQGPRMVEEGWSESLALADANSHINTMDKQQGPTIQHRQLYSTSCD